MPTWNPCPTLPSTRRGGSQMFRSLRERNAKLFFAGLAVSNIGTWLQATAQVLLVRQLGGNGVALGIVTACQFLPMLVIGLWAGALSDRFDRRRLTIITQAAMGVQAIVLGVLDLTNVVTIPIVYAMSLALGIIGAIDNPARRGLATELVERRNLTNVMSLNTSVMTGSRIFGPALAALFANVLGTGWCFVLNGVSFLALLWASGGDRPQPPVPQRTGTGERHSDPRRSAGGVGRSGAAAHGERVRDRVHVRVQLHRVDPTAHPRPARRPRRDVRMDPVGHQRRQRGRRADGRPAPGRARPTAVRVGRRHRGHA